MKKKKQFFLLDYLPAVLDGDAIFLSFDVIGGIVVVNIRARSFTDKPKTIYVYIS